MYPNSLNYVVIKRSWNIFLTIIARFSGDNVEGENSSLLLTSRRRIEILGCAATSRPDFRTGMIAYTYGHNSPELLHNNGIIMGRGKFPSALSKHLSVGRKYGNTH
jgi:hypothetical protein